MAELYDNDLGTGEQQGDEYFHKAVAMMQKNSWFFGPSKSEKIEESINLYTKAGFKYKLAGCYKKAGESFKEVAKLYEMSPYQHHSAAVAWTDAADMFRKVDLLRAQDALNNSIKILLDNNRYALAAKNLKILGEIAEEESQFFEAIIIYEQAVSYFEIDKHPFEAIQTLEKTIKLLIEQKEYKKAIKNLEKIALYHNSTYTHYKTNVYFFEVIVLQLFLDDIVECKKLLVSYCKIKQDFNKSPEYEALEKLIGGYECHDSEKFYDAIHNRKIKIKAWVSDLLVLIQNKFDGDFVEAVEEDLT
jgi:tetratricopeptide (TPR) repeat protein